MLKWYEQVRMESGKYFVSNRIRLARNWAEYHFPRRLRNEEANEMVQRMRDALQELAMQQHENVNDCLLTEISEIRRMAMRERRVLSASILERKAPVALFLSESESLSLVLNGDDHIRLQLMSPNLHMKELYENINRLDDYMNRQFEYAFDPHYGYLTSFPTNVGTGMRANIVLHLPMLSQSKQFSKILESMGQIGVNIRGVYGDGKGNHGDLFDLSNARTLGVSEEEIMALVQKTAMRLNNEEEKIRVHSIERHRLARVDSIFRAYGFLKYARRVTIREALHNLSAVMAGITDGLAKTEQDISIYSLYLGVQPSNLIAAEKGPVDREQIDVLRANYLRRVLPELLER